MTSIDVAKTAAALPDAWNSRTLGRVGTASVKVLRMDDSPIREESHGADELLLVLDGRLELRIAGAEVTVQAGEMYRVPAGAPHAVRPGSHGTLVIVEEPGA
ncbi:cupin domain-containing protein [Kitasatospora cinereorecta]|uniref:Cupin domain-containing protein n=1 Tax=Kitasatospora cinereorecta TaxID=285560 RepID=A0ABW0V7D5_9ACTN